MVFRKRRMLLDSFSAEFFEPEIYFQSICSPVKPSGGGNLFLSASNPPRISSTFQRNSIEFSPFYDAMDLIIGNSISEYDLRILSHFNTF